MYSLVWFVDIRQELSGCTLELGDNSQVFIAKKQSRSTNDNYYGGVFMGGITGVLGKNATISNCTVDLGANVRFGAMATGNATGGSKGDIYIYVGGMVGMMLNNSTIYNAKLEGRSTSIIFAYTKNDYYQTIWYNYYFNKFYSTAGGLVGVNTTDSDWNVWGLGKGTIDGVIYNWSGASVSCYWAGGWAISSSLNIGGDRSKLNAYYFGGNIIGITGYSSNGRWYDGGEISNLYYTFDIATFTKSYTSYVTLKNSDGTTSYNVGIGKGGSVNARNGYAVAISDVITNDAGTISAASSILDNSIKVLSIYQIPYSNNSTQGSGVTINGGTTTTYNNGKSEVTTNYTSVTYDSAYSVVSTVGDLLNWADTTINSNILCSFDADSSNSSSIMWQITIANAISNTGSTLSTPSSGTAITVIPVYKFAASLAEAQQYKNMEYTILRGQGDGMAIYYCMGDSAILSPNQTNYSNKVTSDSTVYYPLKAMMYDGVTDGDSTAISVYDGDGDEITRVGSRNVATILTNAGAYISRVTKVYKNGSYSTELAENESLTDIGSYQVQFTIKSNGLNNNAYVDNTYRVLFFNASGNGATAIDSDDNGVTDYYEVETYTIYMVIAPVSINLTSVTKTYDGYTDLNYVYTGNNSYNYSTLSATIDSTFTYAELSTPTLTMNGGRLCLTSGGTTYASIMAKGRYDSAEVGNRSATFDMEGSMSYTLYRWDNRAQTYYTMDITTYYLDDTLSSKTFFTISSLTTLQFVNDSTHVETYGYGSAITQYTVTNGAACTVKIYKAGAPTIAFDNALTVTSTYIGEAVDFVTGNNLLSHITVTNSLGESWYATDTTKFAQTDFTIAQVTTDIINVSTNAYTGQISVTYNGSQFNVTGATILSMSVYVTPAPLTVVSVVKDYDGTTSTTNATFELTGFRGSDTQGAVSGTYAQSDIGRNIRVTINTTSLTINNTTYNSILTNYCLTTTSWNVGIIVPIAAKVINAYKIYDGTNTVTYSGANATAILIRAGSDGSGSVLSFEPAGTTYTSTQVGTCGLKMTLKAFTDGTSQTKYVLQDGTSMTNYYLYGATGASYTIPNIASILPVSVTVTDVYKTYDGTVDLGTFNMSGLVSGDSITAFDGSYSSQNVTYSNGEFNDVYLNGSSVSLTIHDGSTLSTSTYVVLKHGGNNTNYVLSTTPANTSLSGTTYTIEGQGVILPALVTVTEVVKYYDATYAFDTSSIYALDDANVYATITYNGSTISNFVFTGTMSGKDAGTGYNVSVNTTDLTYGGTTYNWLYNSLNATNNYYVASTDTAGNGSILQLVIKISNDSNSGSINNIYFTTTSLGNKSINASHYISPSLVYETTYKNGQSYGTSNFYATLHLGSSSYQISRGSATIDGATITFTLNQSATDAGVYTFNISMSANGNYTLDDSSSVFYFGIKKQTLEAANVSIVISNLTKVYTGTNSAPTANNATAIKAEVDGETITSWISRSFGAVTVTPGSSVKNAGTYYQGNATNQFVISEIISCESTNYTMSQKAVSNVYNSTSYNQLTYYTITKASLVAVTTIAKEFDGLARTTVSLSGVNSETVSATYTWANMYTMPGEYTSVSASITHSNANYNSVGSAAITLSVSQASVVLERQYSSTNAGTNYFKLAFGITNIKGYNFLMFANSSLTSAMMSEIETSGVSASSEVLTEFVTALNNLYVFKANDAASVTGITEDMIYAINIVSGNDLYKTIEVVLNSEALLDSETMTDRYSIYMMGLDANNEISSSVYASNIAVSSSELADGQFTGTYVETSGYTAISTLDGLNAFLQAGTGNAYLTANIYGYDAVGANATTFNGILDGNGYTIEISGNFNDSNDVYGAFVTSNSGTIRNINFKFASLHEIDADGCSVGLVVGTNIGTIENVSLDIGVDLTIKENTNPQIGGIAGTNSGTITHSTVNFSSNITYSTFGGITYTNSSQMTYVAARNTSNVSTISGYALAYDAGTASYVIDGITLTDTLKYSGTLNNLYGSSTTAISLFNNGYNTRGYVDYYFVTNDKYTTNGALHNVYDQSLETNINATYYYDYDSTDSSYRIAIEVIAPLNRFVWEAFDAYYTTYSTSLNRVVGLFDLTQDLTQVSITMNTAGATLFTPVIGIIVSTVISDGADTIKEYEYTGSQITAEFAAEDSEGNAITLYIAGTNVGIYTQYYEEIEGEEEEQSAGITWNTATFTAQILTSSSSSGEQSIMLIITPKQLSNVETLTKQYDSTNIAETHIDTNSDSTIDIYAVGEFNNTAVGTGYQVKYNSISKSVAAYNNGNGYTFVTYYLSGYDETTDKYIYTVKFIYVDSVAFTSTINLSNLVTAQFAQAYYQLVTLEEIQALAADTTNNTIIYSNGLSLNALESVYVYDLTFERTVNALTSAVTWGDDVYYSFTLYNTNNTRNKNYGYLNAGNEFDQTTILASTSEATTTQYIVSTSGGSITQRTISATYSNLNQSYRSALQAIAVEIANIEDLDNLPYSITQAQKTSLISALNTELAGASFNGDVLGATIDAGNTDIYLSNGNYYATSQEYKEVVLVAMIGTYSVTTNLAVSISSGATLVLRYFEYDSTTERFIIDTFEALQMIDNVEGDYQELDYIVTNNINGKGAMQTTFENVFNGTIDGNGMIIRNFALVGSTATSLFGVLSSTAEVYDLTFVNVMVIATQNATMSIIASSNAGTISNINLDAIYVCDGTIEIKPIAAINTGTISSSIAIIETAKAVASTTTTVLDSVETIVLFRTYGLNGSVTFYVNGSVANYASTSSDVKAIMQTNRLNTPVTITLEVVQIANFREYWAYINLFGYLLGSNTTTFIGYQIILGV